MAAIDPKPTFLHSLLAGGFSRFEKKMHNRLSDWANVAQVVSGVGVIVTLVFLIISVRDNTATTRAAVFDGTMQGLSVFRNNVVNDAEVAELWNAYLARGYDDLDRTSRTRVVNLVALALENQQRAYYARGYGLLGEAEWSRFGTAICFHHRLLAQSEALSNAVKDLLTTEFWEYMTTGCDRGK
jgi:hypothetical protein